MASLNQLRQVFIHSLKSSLSPVLPAVILVLYIYIYISTGFSCDVGQGIKYYKIYTNSPGDCIIAVVMGVIWNLSAIQLSFYLCFFHAPVTCII